MNKLGVASLGLLVLLYQQPLEAQRAVRQPNSATQNSQQDVDFLKLRQEVSELEKKIGKSLPVTEYRTCQIQLPSGEIEEKQLYPPNVGEQIAEAKYDDFVKLASRFGLSFARCNSAAFTIGKSLVIRDPSKYDRYIALSENVAIVSETQSNDNFRNFHYKYQKIQSFPIGNSRFRIMAYPEIIDGIIPLFETNDFDGIAKKISELESEAKKFHSFVYIDENGEKVEHLRPDYYSSQAFYAENQLSNIGDMLLRFIEASYDIGSALIPRPIIGPPFTTVGGNKIILSIVAHTGNDSIAKEERNKIGNISLSIAPNGLINYFFQLWAITYDSQPQSPIPPVYRTLKIEFPLK